MKNLKDKLSASVRQARTAVQTKTPDRKAAAPPPAVPSRSATPPAPALPCTAPAGFAAPGRVWPD